MEKRIKLNRNRRKVRRITLLVILIFLFVLTFLKIYIDNKQDNSYICKNCNVILITFDALRADRFGVFGSGKNLTPNMDEFSKKSIIFPNTISTAAYTATSLTSILSSKYPYIDFSIYGYPTNENYTLINELNKDGYKTISFIMNPLIKDNYFKGFNEEYDGETGGLRDMIPKIKSILVDNEDNKTPFFMWIHAFEPHFPYMPNETFFYEEYPEGLNQQTIYNNWVEQYVKNKTGKEYPSDFNYVNELVHKSDGENFCKFIRNNPTILNSTSLKRNYSFYSPNCIVGMDSTDIEQLNAMYNAYVKQSDSYIKEILDFYETNMSNNTILIISSDHGELIGEHDVIGHGLLYYYYDAIHVPLIIRIPNAKPGVINNVISLVDIAPTILNIIGYESKENIRGISVFKTDSNDIQFAFKNKNMFSDMGITDITVVSGDYKYSDSGIYNIKNDMSESDNVTYENYYSEINILKKAINNIFNEKKTNTTENNDKELENKLRSLGYII